MNLIVVGELTDLNCAIGNEATNAHFQHGDAPMTMSSALTGGRGSHGIRDGAPRVHARIARMSTLNQVGIEETGRLSIEAGAIHRQHPHAVLKPNRNSTYSPIIQVGVVLAGSLVAEMLDEVVPPAETLTLWDPTASSFL